MKKYTLSLLFCSMLLTAAAQTKDEKLLAEAVEKLRLAMISGNRADLESLAAENLSYYHSGGKLENKAAFVEAIASNKSDFVTIALTDQTITVSGKTALVHHKLLADTNDGGKPAVVKLNVLLIWQKQSGKWLLFARSAAKIV